MLRKIFISVFILLFFSLFFSLPKIQAQKSKLNVVVFVRNGCIHCAAEEKFLDSLEKKRNDITVTKYHLEKQDERKVWEDFTTRLEIPKITPITVIGIEYLIGFDKPDSSGEQIIALINKTIQNKQQTDLDKVQPIRGSKQSSGCIENNLECSLDNAQPDLVSLPFIGKINTQSYPLFILSALLGFVDGFNPCAMWVLITFLIILLQVGNRKKMFTFAGIFILAEAIMYSLILTVWYKTWDFVKLDAIITPVVGIVSIVGGFFFLKEWRRKEIECKVTNPQQRQKIRERVQELAISKFTFATFIGILVIAFSVNVFEFACSIGIPQAFTKILELNKLSFLQSGGYIAIYIFFYMIDDLIVFAAALYGAEKLALTTKYSRYSNLVGGILMILIGIILILKPGFLLF